MEAVLPYFSNKDKGQEWSYGYRIHCARESVNPTPSVCNRLVLFHFENGNMIQSATLGLEHTQLEHPNEGRGVSTGWCYRAIIRLRPPKNGGSPPKPIDLARKRYPGMLALPYWRAGASQPSRSFERNFCL